MAATEALSFVARVLAVANLTMGFYWLAWRFEIRPNAAGLLLSATAGVSGIIGFAWGRATR